MTKAQAANDQLKISHADALAYYRGSICQCGGRKAWGQPLCYDCGNRLPPLLRQGLCRSRPAELREALADALEELDLPLPPAPDLKTAGDVVRTRHDATAEYRDQANPATFLR